MLKFQRDLLAISRRLAQRRIKIQESDRPRGKSSRLRVCVHLLDEAIALMRKGILPCCKKHNHLRFLKAVKMVADDLACTRRGVWTTRRLSSTPLTGTFGRRARATA
jgi:hypothetical protein